MRAVWRACLPCTWVVLRQFKGDATRPGRSYLSSATKMPRSYAREELGLAIHTQAGSMLANVSLAALEGIMPPLN